MRQKRVLVVSAHAVDFVWRAGGTIANYTQAGCPCKIIDLSVGARGESESIWKKNPGISEEEVVAIREREAKTCARILGCEIDIYGLKDHLLVIDRDTILRLAEDIRAFSPDIALIHSEYDAFNPDHDAAHKAAMAALRSANVTGTFPGSTPTKQVDIFCFEPDQAIACKFYPNTYIDVTPSWDIKLKAMQSVPSQAFMCTAYAMRTEFTGLLVSKFGEGSTKHGNATHEGVKYAESFVRITPWVSQFFHE